MRLTHKPRLKKSGRSLKNSLEKRFNKCSRNPSKKNCAACVSPRRPKLAVADDKVNGMPEISSEDLNVNSSKDSDESLIRNSKNNCGARASYRRQKLAVANGVKVNGMQEDAIGDLSGYSSRALRKNLRESMNRNSKNCLKNNFRACLSYMRQKFAVADSVKVNGMQENAIGDSSGCPSRASRKDLGGSLNRNSKNLSKNNVGACVSYKRQKLAVADNVKVNGMQEDAIEDSNGYSSKAPSIYSRKDLGGSINKNSKNGSKNNFGACVSYKRQKLAVADNVKVVNGIQTDSSLDSSINRNSKNLSKNNVGACVSYERQKVAVADNVKVVNGIQEDSSLDSNKDSGGSLNRNLSRNSNRGSSGYSSRDSVGNSSRDANENSSSDSNGNSNRDVNGNSSREANRNSFRFLRVNVSRNSSINSSRDANGVLSRLSSENPDSNSNTDSNRDLSENLSKDSSSTETLKFFINNSESIQRLLNHLENVKHLGKNQIVTRKRRYEEENQVGRKYEYVPDEIEKAKLQDLIIQEVPIIKAVHNLGVFAARPIRKSTILGYYQGEAVPRSHQNKRFLLIFNENLSKDAEYCFNWTRFINHSSFSYNCVMESDGVKTKIEAVRKIAAGEQILLNYSLEYPRDGKFIYLHPAQQIFSIDNIVYKETAVDFAEVFTNSSMIKTFGLDKDYNKCLLTRLFDEILSKRSLDDVQRVSRKITDLPSYFSKGKEPLCEQEQITSLMLSCYYGLLEEVLFLLANGADPLRATLYGGRNSMFLTILGVGKEGDKTKILSHLILRSKAIINHPNFIWELLFYEEDAEGKTLCNHILEKELASSMLETFFSPDFLDHFSERVVPFIEQAVPSAKVANEVLGLQLTNIQFHICDRIRNQSPQKKDSAQKADFGHYILVKNALDRVPCRNRGKIKDILDRACEELYESKKISMFKEVFTHCATSITNDKSCVNKFKANVLLNYFERMDITWIQKLRMFTYAFSNTVSWHNRDYEGGNWDSLPAFNFLRSKITSYEYRLIYSVMELEPFYKERLAILESR